MSSLISKTLYILTIVLLFGLFFYDDFLRQLGVIQKYYFGEMGYVQFLQGNESTHNCPIVFLPIKNMVQKEAEHTRMIRINPKISGSKNIGCDFSIYNFADTPLLFNARAFELNLGYFNLNGEKIDTRRNIGEDLTYFSPEEVGYISIPSQTKMLISQDEIKYNSSINMVLQWRLWLPYALGEFYWGAPKIEELSHNFNGRSLFSNRIVICDSIRYIPHSFISNDDIILEVE